ncbi:hypothetical protein EJB05_10526, partial [Eragrostis curvula]
MDPDPEPPLPLPNNPSAELDFDFQSLNISHKEEIQIDFENQIQEPVSSPFKLLFKAGPPVGKASRNVTTFMFERAMRAAWGSRFYKVKQVDENIFMAYFRTEEDQRWVWQKQPWIAERETMMVEWADPSGRRPKESYTFRYLPVNIHLYGIPRSLRSVDLIEKIIEKIGVKDNSVVMTGNAMFRIPEYVIARVILDVMKPLLDSITISISKEKKIKVYIHYEKLVKVCNFCGHLFHNVSSCNKRQAFIWKLNPADAIKVPEEIYGKWRTQEQEIPAEAREDEENNSWDPHIQSFKDFFGKSAAASSSPNASAGSMNKEGIFSENSSRLQMVPSAGKQSSAINATVQGMAGDNLQLPERSREKSFPTSQVQPRKGIFGHGPPPFLSPSDNIQNQWSQGQTHSWYV